MIDATLPPPGEEDVRLAGEYVLGVLAIQDRIAAENRARRDPAFANAVAAWELRLSGLDENFREVKAPNLLPILEERLFGKPETRQPFWRNWFAGAGVAAALAVAVLAFLPMTPVPGPGFVPVTTLATDADSLRYEIGRDGNRLRITRVAGAAADSGLVHELWLIAGEAAPVSLGLIVGDEAILPAPALAAGVILAVSLEPAGGSPTGAPTGPVLVTGVVTDI
ncbi:MAG: anti-sigma factor domain-containing protein [Pseudorhodobacter sp.]